MKKRIAKIFAPIVKWLIKYAKSAEVDELVQLRLAEAEKERRNRLQQEQIGRILDDVKTPMTFELAVEFILEKEGGYVNDPDDPGGETKFGISKRAFPRINISDLTESHAKELYHQYYWQPMRCNELPDRLRLPVFDCAVNQGIRRATKFLPVGPNAGRNINRANVIRPWIFLFPALFALGLYLAYPVFETLRLSLPPSWRGRPPSDRAPGPATGDRRFRRRTRRCPAN